MPREPFASQPLLGVGTAFVVGADKMITAAHVINKSADQYAVVFGFECSADHDKVNTFISADSVYFLKKIGNRSDEADVVAFQVNRRITSPPLMLDPSKDLFLKQEIYMIGHPYGLPKKIAGNASIVQNDDAQSFYTSLDAFQGNSGSPVFSIKTHAVVGILVSGEVDYYWNGTCRVSTICTPPFCRGEKAIRMRTVKELFGL